MIDPQDPLPEGKFVYRRIFSYGVAVMLIGLLAFVIYRMDTSADLRTVALYLCLLLFAVITYYMVAPSAEQIARIIQSAKVLIARRDPEDQ